MVETEKKTRANPDYSKTAVNLTNPPDIGEQLLQLQDHQAKVKILKATLEAYPEYNEMQGHEEAIAAIITQIKEMIDAHGSYQDIESGFYAVKYQRISKSYQVEPFKANYPKLAPAVVEEIINVKALEGMVKGGLVSEADLRIHQVLVETPSYAFYIR